MKFVSVLILFSFMALTTIGQPIMDKETLTTELIKRLDNWTVSELVPGGRIDAVRFLNDSVVVCGVRGDNRGKLFISENKGITWKFLGSPTDAEITCIAETSDRNVFYFLTGRSEVYVTKNGGRSWKKLATLTSNKNRDGAAASYSIISTSHGTLLVTDTDSDGGHIFRSTDKGKKWKDLGVIGKDGLYRFEKINNAILVNGFDGNVYKSYDDGSSWKLSGELSQSAMFATEYLDGSTLLQADKEGNIFSSHDNGKKWSKVARLSGAADDFIHLKYGLVYYSTYTEEKSIYASIDYGKHWFELGKVPTTAKDDWLDHGVGVETKDSIIVIAGTGKGYILRNALPTKWLKEIADGVDPKSLISMETTSALLNDSTATKFRNPRIVRRSSKNLVPNASFETGKDGWSTQGKPTGWGGDLWDLYGELDNKNAFEGKYSLRIDLGKDKTPVTYFDSWPAEKKFQLSPLTANKGWIDVIPGEKYTFSVYMRSNADSVPGMLTVFQGLNLSKEIRPSVDTSAIILHKQWNRYSITVVALDKQMFVAAGPNLTNNETATTVWIDAYQLEKGEKATEFLHYDPIEIGFETNKFGNIFNSGDNISISLTGYNKKKQTSTIAVKCTATDYFDNNVWESTKSVKLISGNTKTEWPMQLPGLGYYKLEFSWIQNGITYYKIFPISIIDFYKEDDSPFGINHAPTTEKACKAIQQAGIMWARNWSINWGFLEPEENKLSFQISDDQIGRDQYLGFKTLALLPPLPSTNWNSTAPDSIPAKLWYRAAYMPKEKAKLMEFISKTINHYREKIKIWEFLNEPIWTKFCLPGEHYGLPGADYYPDDYTQLLKDAYATMKSSDPASTVIGGFSAEPWRYTKNFIQSGGLKFVDILNIHNYGGFAPPESFIPEMDSLLSYMDQYGTRKPIWITEYAYYATDDLPWTPWEPPANYSAANLLLKNEKQCADWTIRYNVIMLAKGVDKIFFHQGAGGQVNHSVLGLEFPFLSDYAEPRKVYAAQSALATMLGSTFKFSGSLHNKSPRYKESAHTTQLYGFQCKDKSVLIGWISENEKEKITLHLPEDVEVYNIMGNPININNIATLGCSPIYIVSKSKSVSELLKSCKINYEK